jgi:aminopeptidase-like protein
MSIGQIYIEGKVKKEILLSTNICHPSMVNNELVAPVILSYISKYFQIQKSYFSIKILFLPETIGAITYLNKNLKQLKKNFHAGFHISCFGDKGKFSMVSTKYNNSYSDEVAKKKLKEKKNFKIYPFKYCGSDERQYNFPGIDLPVVTLTKTKFGKFPEYHNSSDNLKITDPQTLQKSYNFLLSIINEINKNQKEVINKTVPNIKSSKNGNKKNKFELKIFSKTKCEPFLSKRKLYRTVSDKLLTDDEFIMFNTLYYGDGIKIKDLSKIILKKPKRILNIAEMLKKNDLIELKF